MVTVYYLGQENLKTWFKSHASDCTMGISYFYYPNINKMFSKKCLLVHIYSFRFWSPWSQEIPICWQHPVKSQWGSSTHDPPGSWGGDEQGWPVLCPSGSQPIRWIQNIRWQDSGIFKERKFFRFRTPLSIFSTHPSLYPDHDSRRNPGEEETSQGPADAVSSIIPCVVT